MHLEEFPKYDDSQIDEKLEIKMDLVRTLVSMGRTAREKENIKVRQPLSEVILDAKNKEIIGDLTELIKEELNIKEVIFEKDLSKYMNLSLTPNFKVAGPVFGKNINKFKEELQKLIQEQIKELEEITGDKFNIAI